MTNEPTTRNLSRRSVLGATAGGLLALAGCRGLGGGSSSGSGGTKTLSLTWWSEGKRAQRTIDVAHLFEKAHKGVHIDAQFSDFGGYYDKLATRVAGGNPPDIFQVHITELADYAKRGAVRPLDDLVPDPLHLTGLPSYVLDSCKYQGKLYFVPLGLATQPSLVYNRTKLDSLGVPAPDPDWALDDFHQFVRAVSKAGGGKVYGTSDMGGSPPAFEAFVRSKGTQLFTEDGKLAFSKDVLQEWYGLWDQLRHQKATVPMKISAGVQGFANDPLTTGQAAITVAASSKGIAGYGNIVKDKLESVPFPRHEKGGPVGTLVTPIEWWALSSKMPKEKATLAAQFANFAITSPKAASAWTTDHGVPLFADLREKTYAEADGLTKLIYDDFDTVQKTNPSARTLYPPGSGELIQMTLKKLNQDVGFGKSTVQKAVTTFYSEADRILG